MEEENSNRSVATASLRKDGTTSADWLERRGEERLSCVAGPGCIWICHPVEERPAEVPDRRYQQGPFDAQVSGGVVERETQATAESCEPRSVDVFCM